MAVKMDMAGPAEASAGPQPGLTVPLFATSSLTGSGIPLLHAFLAALQPSAPAAPAVLQACTPPLSLMNLLQYETHFFLILEKCYHERLTLERVRVLRRRPGRVHAMRVRRLPAATHPAYLRSPSRVRTACAPTWTAPACMPERRALLSLPGTRALPHQLLPARAARTSRYILQMLRLG